MATGLRASVLHAGDFEYDFPCTECQEHSEAVYFCQHCTRQFCGLCIKQHDRFYRRHPVLGTEKRDFWGNVKSTCKLHPGEEMMVFCRDHGHSCCVECQKELHRQYKHVILLQHTPQSPPIQPVLENTGKITAAKDSGNLQFKNKEKVGTSSLDTLPLKPKDKVGITEHYKLPLTEKVRTCERDRDNFLLNPKKKVGTTEPSKSPVLSVVDPSRPYTVIERKHLNVKLESDKYLSPIYGISVLPEGELIITDFDNKKLMLLSADYTVVDHTSVPEGPRDICAVSDNQIAVCNGGKEVQLFNVENGKLKMDRTLQLDRDCNHMSFMAGNLYVASNDSVYQYTLAGERVRKIYTADEWGVYRIAVSPDGERIYVSDDENNQLVTVDMQGQVLAILNDEGLERPQGVCVSPRGQVFVCGRLSNTILQVDSEGKHILPIIANKSIGVSIPQSVCFESRTSSLLVGQFNEKSNDNLLVLKLK